jgi:pilus assembly protein CpaB
MAALKWTGIAMLAAALMLGVISYRAVGVRLARRASENAGASLPHRVVVAVRPIPAGRSIASDAIALQGMGMWPEGGFKDVEQVAGRVPYATLSVGEPVLEKHFETDSTIARTLQANERAVAVEVDGVTGLGGFVRPGDIVDVLFFLRRDGREVSDTQARTLLRAVRVIAFGSLVGPTDESAPKLDARSAVLAVPQQHAALLLLADVAGTLRLALRQPAEPSEDDRSGAVTLSEVLASPGRSLPGSVRELPQPRTSPIPIIRGPLREPRAAGRGS